MIRRLLVTAVLGVSTTGCAAGIQTGFEELHPAAAPVVARSIAVLPVLAEAGSESYGWTFADSLLSAAELAHPWIEFVSPDIALDRLDAAGLAEPLADLLADYEEAGSYDRSVLRAVGEALSVDHVLQLRVGYERVNEVESSLLDPGALYGADRQNLRVTLALWDVKEGALAWEAAGTSTTRDAEYELPRSFAEVVAVAAAELAGRIPLRPAEPAPAAGPAGG